MGLGPAGKGGVSLGKARDLAQLYRDQVASGIDPLEEQTREAKRRRLEAAVSAAKAMTFRDAARRYIEVHSPNWKNPKHRDQWPNTLRDYAHPVLGDLLVRDITPSHVQEALLPIWLSKHETALKVLQRIRAVLDMTISSGARRTEPGPRPDRIVAEGLPRRSPRAFQGPAIPRDAGIHGDPAQ